MNGFGGGGIGMVLFWILIVVGIVVVIKWTAGRRTPHTETDSAVEILKKRYARGEISKEEFERMKRDVD